MKLSLSQHISGNSSSLCRRPYNRSQQSVIRDSLERYLTVFTKAVAAGTTPDAAFPSRKAALRRCCSGHSICENEL